MILLAQETDRVSETVEMEPFSVRKCPRCNCLYSTTFPEANSRTACHLPLLLDCGHGVCFGCVKSVFLKCPAVKHMINCANCAEKTEITNFQLFHNVISLIHWYLLGLTHLYDYELVNRCNQIGFKESTSNSNTSTISTSSEEGKKKCKEHGKTLKMWCRKDKEMVCSNCVIIGKHKGHNIVLLEEQNAEAFAALEQSISTSKEMRDKLNAKFKMFESINHTLKNNYASAKEQVRVKYAYLHGLLLKHESATHKLLDSECSSRLKHFQDLGIQFCRIHRQLCDLIRESEAVLQNKSISPLCVTELIEKLGAKLATCQGALSKQALISSYKNGPKLVTSPQFEECFKVPEGTLMYTESVPDDEVVFETSAPSPAMSISTSSESDVAPPPEEIKSIGLSFALGSSFVGCVSYVKSPKRFYMQPLKDQSEEFQKLQGELQTQGPPTSLNLSVGMLVAARYEVDQIWYRGIIERIQPGGAYVCFIDYGNKDFLPFEAIRTLERRHHSLPAQAVLCSLSTRKRGSCDRGSFKDFKVMVEDRVLGADVEDIRQGRVGKHGTVAELMFYVTLYECEQGPSNSFNSRLDAKSKETTPEKVKTEPPVANGTTNSVGRQPDPPESVETLATPLFVPPLVGQENIHKTRVLLLSMESPGYFFVRRAKKVEAYLNFQRQLNDYCRIHRPILLTRSEISVGQMYVVQWSIDEIWERCVVSAMDQEYITLTLIDAGVRTKVTDRPIYRLDKRWHDNTDAKALLCSVWGLKPAGGGQTWSRTSMERMAEFLKKGTGLFVEIYDILDDIHYVRLYFEYVKPGEGLECDTAETTCINDELFDLGLALRHIMPVSKDVRANDWIPPIPLPTGRSFKADLIWVDDSGIIYLHLPGQSSAVLNKLSVVLNGYFTKSAPSIEDLYWKPGEPCIAKRREDQLWYRARVIHNDDETQTCRVQYVDYGDDEDKIAYTNMRKTLLCTTYPIQAARCFLSQLDGLRRPMTTAEADTLHKAIVDKSCNITVVNADAPVPLVTINIGNSASDLPSIIESIKLAAGGDEKEVNCGAFQDPYQPLAIPLGHSVPIRILSVMENMLAVIQPLDCDTFAVPYEWNRQVYRYKCYQRDLQVQAPNFVLLSKFVSGTPCAILNGDDNLWYRGTIHGRCEAEPSQIRVHLVDLDHFVNVNAASIRELPKSYMCLNRHSATICLKENPTRPYAYYLEKMQPINGPDSRNFWACFEPEDGRETAYPITHLMYRKPNGQLMMIF